MSATDFEVRRINVLTSKLCIFHIVIYTVQIVTELLSKNSQQYAPHV
jgi:hypothetical protein